MIVAISKVTNPNIKSNKFLDRIKALVLLDTETKKIVMATTNSIYEAIKEGKLSVDNLEIKDEDLKEKGKIAYHAKSFGNKSKRIIYKHYNLIAIINKNDIEVKELTEEEAEKLEQDQLSYDIDAYEKRSFIKRDIQYEKLSPLPEEEIKNSLNNVKTNEEQVTKVETLENIGDPSCPICKGKGRYTAGLFGLLLTCECVTKKMEREAAEKLKKEKEEIVYKVTGAQKIQVVAENLIPENRKGDEFSVDILKERIFTLYGPRNGTVSSKAFTNYVQLLNGIIASISIGEPLTVSYIIGAPNGFGKNTFVNTCIKRLYAKGKKAVPYKSLFEIADLRMKHIENLENIFKREYTGVKETEESEYTVEEKTYTWQDYCDAEIVFCYLTTPDNGWVEMNTLKALVLIRATKGLATIVMTDSPLQAYVNNPKIKKYVLDDILAYDKEHGSLDRLVHQSIYIKYKTNLEAMAGEDY